MIDRIVVENFKSLRRIDLKLGRVNFLIGASASGKSNFLDALHVLQGAASGFDVGDILDGFTVGDASAWGGIRGGRSGVRRAGDHTGTAAIGVWGRFGDAPSQTWELQIAFAPADGVVVQDRLRVGAQTVWSAPPGGRSFVCCAGGSLPRSADPSVRAAADRVSVLLADMQCLDPTPAVLREHSHPRSPRLGGQGENFASVVDEICRDGRLKDAWLSWVRILSLGDAVEDAGTLTGAAGGLMFALRENGAQLPAPVLGGGVLRAAAIAAAFFQQRTPPLMVFDGIEKGLHPARMASLLELLRSQAEVAGTQVVAKTHSSAILDWLWDVDHGSGGELAETTFLFRRGESGDSVVRPLADVPRLAAIAAKKPVSELFSEGWMEMVP